MRKIIDNILAKICVVLLSLLVLDVVWQVFTRFVMSSPSSFTDEMAGYLLIWVGLLGAAYVTGQREHLAIDLLIQKSKGKRKQMLIATTFLVVFVFALFALVIGGGWLMYTRFLWNVKSAALGLPLGCVYFVLPLAGIFIMYYAMDDFIKVMRGDFPQ